MPSAVPSTSSSAPGTSEYRSLSAFGTTMRPALSLEMWRDFHAEDLARAGAGPDDVLFIGDSIPDAGDEFLEKDGTLAPAIMPDALRLTEAGYRIWAEMDFSLSFPFFKVPVRWQEHSFRQWRGCGDADS